MKQGDLRVHENRVREARKLFLNFGGEKAF